MKLEAFQEIITVMDSIFPVNFFIVTQGGKIHWANERMLKNSGVLTLEEIKGKDASIFGEEEWIRTKKVINNKKSHICYETAANKTFLTMKVPYFENEFHGAIGLSIDITSLKQAEQAKNEFLMNMSHDLRTPFTGVYKIAELLYQSVKDEAIKEDLNYIVMSARQWMDVINNILTIMDVSVMQNQLTYFNIKDLISEIKSLYAASIKCKGLKLKVSCPDQLIWAYDLRLKQLLITLVSNAVKFTERGIIWINVFIKKKFLILEVKDTGIGIAKEHQHYIFGKFNKIKSSNSEASFSGSGIGLYIAKQYVEQMNGRIELESKLGKGSTFKLKIPFEGLLLSVCFSQK